MIVAAKSAASVRMGRAATAKVSEESSGGKNPAVALQLAAAEEIATELRLAAASEDVTVAYA